MNRTPRRSSFCAGSALALDWFPVCTASRMPDLSRRALVASATMPALAAAAISTAAPARYSRVHQLRNRAVDQGGMEFPSPNLILRKENAFSSVSLLAFSVG